MRLTVEQLRAGARQARRWIEHVGDLRVGNVAWKSGAYLIYAHRDGDWADMKAWDGAGGSRCCPATEMGSDGSDVIYCDMNDTVRAAMKVDWPYNNPRMSDVVAVFGAIVAAADLTERAAARARARREEFEAARVVLLEEVTA